MSELSLTHDRPGEDPAADLAVRLHREHAAAGLGGPAPVPDDVAAGLDSRSLKEVRGTLRVLAALDAPAPGLVAPPAGLWDRIAADLDGTGEDGAGLGSDAAPAEPAVRAAGRDDVVVPLAGRRAAQSAARAERTRWRPVAAAAAAGLLVGGLGVGLALSGRDDAADGAPVAQPTPAEEVLGDAQLDPVVQDGQLALAEMRREQDGELRLEVRVPAVPDAEDGYLEVWLRDEAASRMISLGTVSTQDAVLTVPEGVRLAEYPVVDVSHEHFDGDPTHSGTSLWVGEMVRRS